MNDRNSEQNEGVESAAQPQFCANNCGFFANPACLGYCSKCFKQKAAAKASPPPAPVPQLEVQEPIEKVVPPCQPSAPQVVEEEQDNPYIKKANRCHFCNKKLKTVRFTCKCSNTYCSAHRLAEDHSCDFDFKQFERQKIADSNPVVAGSKLEKI